MENTIPSFKLSYLNYIFGIATLVSASIGTLYMVINYFRKDLFLTQDQKIQIEEIRQDIEESNCEITTEAAKQIIALINEIATEISNSRSYIHDKRRTAMKNQVEYHKLCKETLKIKDWALREATRKVLHQFGNISV